MFDTKAKANEPVKPRYLVTFLNEITIPDESVAKYYMNAVMQHSPGLLSHACDVTEYCTFGQLAFEMAHWHTEWRSQEYLGNTYCGKFWETYQQVVDVLEAILPDKYTEGWL